jgi:hypothetical protein
VRAEWGLANGEGGGITLPVGADIDSGRFLLVLSVEQEERLLDLELFDRGEDGLEEFAGAVDMREAEDAVVAMDSADG